MNKGTLALLLLLIAGVAAAEVYKWADESGRVHYGDSPPPESDAQSVKVPEVPTQEEVERAQRLMREKIDQYKESPEEATLPTAAEKPSQEAEVDEVAPENVACFSPLSDLIEGPSAETFTPVTPTLLTKAQQKSLLGLFGKPHAHWRGTITDLTCLGNSSSPKRSVTHFETEATVDWDVRKSRFTIESDTIEKESGDIEQLIQSFKIADALYFTNNKPADTIALDGNKVELLTLHKNRVSFLIKRHISTGPDTRRPRAEVRYLKITGKTLTLVELYYHGAIFTGSRHWILRW